MTFEGELKIFRIFIRHSVEIVDIYFWDFWLFFVKSFYLLLNSSSAQLVFTKYFSSESRVKFSFFHTLWHDLQNIYWQYVVTGVSIMLHIFITVYTWKLTYTIYLKYVRRKWNLFYYFRKNWWDVLEDTNPNVHFVIKHINVRSFLFTQSPPSSTVSHWHCYLCQ